MLMLKGLRLGRGVDWGLLGWWARHQIKMKTSKWIAALALAGLFGITEAEAKSHKGEIKSLEKQRAQLQAEHRESRDRLKELNHRVGRKVVENDDEPDEWESDADSDETEVRDEEFKRVGSDRIDADLIKEREAEAARAKAAAKEMARIDKAIRREKARERLEREREGFLI